LEQRKFQKNNKERKTDLVENEKRVVSKRHLKNYLISRHDQLRIALITLLYMSIIVMLTAGIVMYPFLSDLFFSEDLKVQYRASQAFLLLLNRLLPAVVIIFILVVLHQILITHRIWGPLVNVTNTIKMVGKGDFTRKVSLRKNDYLENECRQINEMIEGLSSHISNIKENHVKLTSTLDKISESIKNINTQNEFEECLKEIRSKAELLAEDLSCFKLETEITKNPSGEGR